jgi:hypothetical protein
VSKSYEGGKDNRNSLRRHIFFLARELSELGRRTFNHSVARDVLGCSGIFARKARGRRAKKMIAKYGGRG